MPTFRFGKFLLRPAVPTDLAMADLWTMADPDHRNTTKAEFWLLQSQRINSFLLKDDLGPVFFIQMRLVEQGAVEIHMQFRPDESTPMRLRTMNAMSAGMVWLEKMLSGLGYKTIYFNSKSPRLILFCQKRLGFTWDGRRLEKAVPKGIS